MGRFQIPEDSRRKAVYRKSLETFDVIYNYGSPSQYSVTNSKMLTLSSAILRRSAIVKSDTFHPTTYGGIGVIVNSPMGSYKGSRNGGYTPYEPVNNANISVIDEFGYTEYAGNVNMAPRIYWSDNDMNNVKTRAMSKFGADEFHTGIFLAEAVETSTYIADKAATLFKMVNAVRKGNVSALRKAFRTLKGKKITARNTSGQLAERWLEYKYAVMPIFNDTAALINMFNNGIDHSRRDELRPWELVTSAFLKKDEHNDVVNNGYYKFKVWHKLSYYCKLWATIDDAELFAKSKIGINSIAEPLWELIPFSFVWDWMMPIGTFLQALTATSGLKFSRGFTRFRVETHGIVESIATGGLNDRDGGKHFTADITAMARIALPSFPTVMPYVKNPFSTDHAITALSLFRVLFINNKPSK